MLSFHNMENPRPRTTKASPAPAALLENAAPVATAIDALALLEPDAPPSVLSAVTVLVASVVVAASAEVDSTPTPDVPFPYQYPDNVGLVAAAGCEVTTSGWLVTTDGWPVMTPRESVWVV